MNFKKSLFLFSILFSFAVYAQNMADYTDNWEGSLENSKTFSLKVEISSIELDKAIFKISNENDIFETQIKANNSKEIQVPIGENSSFTGILSDDGKEINGFIKSGLLLYHLKLSKSDPLTYSGNWNILMVDELKSQHFYLSLENGDSEEYQAYPILADNRFTGTWCANFQKENDEIHFSDFKTGLQFKGKLLSNEINLEILLEGYLLTEIQLKKSTSPWRIGQMNVKPVDYDDSFSNLEKHIHSDSLPNTHSVLISKNGKIIYENYFHGYNENLPHDMKSASKSISSAFVGLAKDHELFDNVNQSIFEFLPEEYQKHNEGLKSKIDIKSLLTMSSGLDAIDYGINSNSKSSATEDNYQMSQDWTASVLEAPMIHPPNKKANYGSANPYLLGLAMDSLVDIPLELFVDQNLFQPLGISNYIIQTDLKGKPYFGGGMYLTPKDMLKFGEMYLNSGKVNEKQVLPKEWIEESFKNYRPLENTEDKNGYGYFWWHHIYEVNGKTIKSIEARGAGGQYIFIVPELNIVSVITSGNFRNGKTQQPESIFEKYILPVIVD
ncbi:serine hydrolase domain-containing protein [Brumimicrobium mesophilum]|uniref:serine hydrolase domain-containing protein n=1 Tax=Brumimicrobium mesophilum TaxID=392717 RepID=UPI000D143E65|nr:serine hydrolase [Brumimicrobium mesophilum]